MPKLIAITACVSGVAHTYMAAEQLKKLCHHRKWIIQIETQGALGVENQLTEESILNADCVIFITDIQIDQPERFQGMRQLQLSTKAFLSQPDHIISPIKKLTQAPQGTIIKLS